MISVSVAVLDSDLDNRAGKDEIRAVEPRNSLSICLFILSHPRLTYSVLLPRLNYPANHFRSRPI